VRVVEEVKDQLRRTLAGAYLEAKAAGDLAAEPDVVLLEVPKERAHGDFATNLAMMMARVEKKAPRAVAEAIVRHIRTEGTPVASVEIAGPGFINIRLHPGWMNAALVAVQQEGERYGQSRHGGGRRILLEYVSANPTGPMVLVQARSGALGSALDRLLNWAGYRCETEFYINDGGTQIEQLAKSVDLRARQQAGEQVEFSGEYPGEYVLECAADLLKEYPDFLVRPEAERYAFLERWAPEYFRRGQEEVLRNYGVVFDNWFRESTLRASGAVDEVVRRLIEMGAAYEQDGAVWMRTTAYGDDKDRVIVRSNGESTYFCADAAYHMNKYDRGYDLLINILGQDHHGYEGRLKAMAQCLGHGRDTLEILFTQMVRLFKDGEEVRMSKRRGTFVLMEDLLDEVSVDAARFFFLMRSFDVHMDFDMNLANLKSNENPVYYVQYAHARICSMLRQAEEGGHRVSDAKAVDLRVLADESEVDLIRKIAEFPEEIISAAEAREPARVTRYVVDLATSFHSFYNRCRVISGDPTLTGARLVLVDGVRRVVANALGLLGVTAPERM
jgi:arginyl-tRNA synthetase